ncbi:MAG TPA: hypothetical protein VIO33_21275 [Burkholderiaceae bacterium]
MAIQFIDHGSTQGFQVRVGPRHAALTKFFAVRKHGGARRALAAARAAETELARHAEASAGRTGARRRAPANNTSGLVGVRPRYVVFSDVPYLYFVASWSVNGKPRCTSFSAEKHGLLGALELAMQRRERSTGVRYDVTPRQAWSRMKHLVSATLH